MLSSNIYFLDGPKLNSSELAAMRSDLVECELSGELHKFHQIILITNNSNKKKKKCKINFNIFLYQLIIVIKREIYLIAY
jgi:hypothetical protein